MKKDLKWGKERMEMTFKKKLAGLAAAAALALAMAPVAAFGDAGALTADTTISVTGVEAGAQVTAYKVVKVDQTNTATDGTAGWALAGTFGTIQLSDIIGTNANGISATEAATIANAAPNADPALTTVPLTEASGTYSATVTEPGLYVVLVKGTGATVYNPMFVGADYSTDSPNTLSAATNYSGSAAVAKKSEPDLTKTANQASDKAVQAGDSVGFTITTQVPYYPSPYYSAQSVSFVITDKLDPGLSLPTAKSEVQVLAGDSFDELVEGTDYELTLDTTTRTMTISFKAAYLQDEHRANKGGVANGITPIKVVYDATVSDVSAFTAQVTEMTNAAKIEYTNNPGTGTDAKHESDEKKTHHYTFGVDANLVGPSGTTGKTSELRKIAVNANGEIEYETIETSFNDTDKPRGPLQGAVFTLTGTSTDGVAYSQTATTDADGRISFNGLDADVVYTMVETSAPAGYQLDSTQYNIKVVATYNEPTANEDATLASYTVQFKKADAQEWTNLTTYTIENEGGEITTATVEEGGVTALIKNVKAGILPSTGGSGIFFYVFAGAAIMALAVILSRRNRKNAKSAA